VGRGYSNLRLTCLNSLQGSRWYFHTSASGVKPKCYSSLGIASLASQLHARGIGTRIFDSTFSNLEQIQKDLSAYQPHIVGVYSIVSLSRNTFRIAKMVRDSLTDSLIVVGGPMPTVYPECYSQLFDLEVISKKGVRVVMRRLRRIITFLPYFLADLKPFEREGGITTAKVLKFSVTLSGILFFTQLAQSCIGLF